VAWNPAGTHVAAPCIGSEVRILDLSQIYRDESRDGDASLAFDVGQTGELVLQFTDITQNLGGNRLRGVPVNDPSWDYDPASDSDGSGQCYLTQNEMGNTDVDNGAVQLISPTLDLSGGDVTISYDYYLYLTNTDGSDRLLVEIDGNDGAGPWVEIARHDTNGGLSWRSHVIEQADLDAREADRIFRLLMGDNVEERRRFIEENAVNVKNLDV